MLPVCNRNKWTNTLENGAVEAVNYQVDIGVLRIHMVVLEHKVEKEFMRLMPGLIKCNGIYSWKYVLTGSVLL